MGSVSNDDLKGHTGTGLNTAIWYGFQISVKRA